MKMNNKICLDENYSTTRLLVKGKHEIINNPGNQGSGHNPLLLEKLSYNISNKTNGILWQEDLD